MHIDLATRGDTLGAMATALDGMIDAEARDGRIAGTGGVMCGRLRFCKV